MKVKKWFFLSIVILSMLACFPIDYFQARHELDLINPEERSIMEQTEDAGTEMARTRRQEKETEAPVPPTATQEVATATSTLPPATQTVLALAAEGYFVDGVKDGLDCETGESALDDLPAGMDIHLVKSSFDEEEGTYVFVIRFAASDSLNTSFFGGIGILNPFGPTVNDPGLIFEDKANHMIYFHHVPDQKLEVIRLSVPSSDAGWRQVEETSFNGTAEGNTITLYVPVHEVAPEDDSQSMDLFSYFPLSLTENNTYCDVMGEEVFTLLELPAPPEGF